MLFHYIYRGIRRLVNHCRGRGGAGEGAGSAGSGNGSGGAAADQENGQQPQRAQSQPAGDSEHEKPVYSIYFYVVFYVGFVMSFDMSVSLISIQSYWHVLAPDKEGMYGFVFGSYDLANFIAVPILGILADKFGLKPTFIISLFLNVAGNVLYATAFIAHVPFELANGLYAAGSWPMMLAGRMLAGAGSGAMAMGVIYIANMTTRKERSLAVGTYRVSQTIARFAAPFVTMPLSFMSWDTTTTTGALFNFYTIPGWIAAGLSLIGLLLVIAVFRSPTKEELSAVAERDGLEAQCMSLKFSVKEAKELLYHVRVLAFLGFSASAAYMAVYSQMFGFGVGQYKFVDGYQDLWMLYVGFAVAAPLGATLWRGMLARGVPDYVIYCLGLGTLAASMPFLIGYTENLSRWLYWVGFGIMLIGVIFVFPMLDSFYTKKITQLRVQAANRLGAIVAILPSFSSLGRFLGPTIAGFILVVQQADDPCSVFMAVNATLGCPGSNQAYGDNAQAYLSRWGQPAGFCLLTYPAYFFESGCSVENTRWFLPLLMAILLAFLLHQTVFYLPRHRNTTTPEAPLPNLFADEEDKLQKDVERGAVDGLPHATDGERPDGVPAAAADEKILDNAPVAAAVDADPVKPDPPGEAQDGETAPAAAKDAAADP